MDGLRQGLRSVLADRAELQGCGAQSAFQLGDSRIHGCAGGDDGLLGGLFLRAIEGAAAGTDQRSAFGGDIGGGACPRIRTMARITASGKSRKITLQKRSTALRPTMRAMCASPAWWFFWWR